MEVSLVIVNWNGRNDTLECLQSLAKLETDEVKVRIIVVENGSTNKSLSISEQDLQNIKSDSTIDLELVESKKNLGFSGGNNLGIERSLKLGSAYVLLLNNDTIVAAGLLQQLLSTSAADPQVGVIGPKIYFAPGFEFHQDRYTQSERGKVIWYAGGVIDWANMLAYHRGVDEVDEGQYNRRQKTDFVSGCCMLVRAEVFRKVGMLDDQLFLYLEDLDFCLRAKKAGFKLIYDPEAFIWHKNASSTERPGSDLHQYYQTRNRLIIGMRYAPWRTKFALLRESLRFFKEGWVRKKAVVDFYLHRWGRQNV